MADDFVLVPRKPTFGMMDAFSGARWVNLEPGKQQAELDAYAAMLAAAPAQTEVTRCNICGFVVDTRFKAEKPTIEWSPAGRAREGELQKAIRCTASQGNYDEALIRRAVGFALAEAIVDARAEIMKARADG